MFYVFFQVCLFSIALHFALKITKRCSFLSCLLKFGYQSPFNLNAFRYATFHRGVCIFRGCILLYVVPHKVCTVVYISWNSNVRMRKIIYFTLKRLLGRISYMWVHFYKIQFNIILNYWKRIFTANLKIIWIYVKWNKCKKYSELYFPFTIFIIYINKSHHCTNLFFFK